MRLRDFIPVHDPEAAQRIAERLGGAVQRLAGNPHLGKAVEDLPDVREWIVGRYVIRYVVAGDTLTLARIWHGRDRKSVV